MKATKKIVGAACALVAAVALSAGSTFAWFVSNTSVKAEGLQVDVATSNSYLVIAESYANLRADREDPTKISLAPTEENPVKKLEASAHKEVAASAEGEKIVADGLTTASNWYYGKGSTPTDGTLKGDKTPLESFDNYVVQADIFVSVATGSDAVNNVMMKMEAVDGWDATVGNSAISVVILYQNIENGAESGSWTYVEANDANNHAISAASHGYLDLGAVTEDDYLQIHIMVYFDGNNDDVKGVNAASLEGVTLNFTFADKTSLSLS